MVDMWAGVAVHQQVKSPALFGRIKYELKGKPLLSKKKKIKKRKEIEKALLKELFFYFLVEPSSSGAGQTDSGKCGDKEHRVSNSLACA